WTLDIVFSSILEFNNEYESMIYPLIKSRHSPAFSFGSSPRSAQVGLYFMGCPVHSDPDQPHKTEPKVSAHTGHYP
ncbi:hypothetical protein, partial [Fibrobacter sp. UWEL]|uniref:hypothetical protein n=1 Tax=Fibrobacter sp. UWEL TaxID=1896209 RepID=UPI001F3254F1